jgi:hypothetical protein
MKSLKEIELDKTAEKNFLKELVNENYKDYGLDRNDFKEEDIQDVKFKAVEKGAMIHSDLGKLNFSVKGCDKKIRLFIKEANHKEDVSGELERSKLRDRTERDFLIYATGKKAYVPSYRKEHEFEDEDKNKHNVLFMDGFDTDLEEKLYALSEEKKTANETRKGEISQQAGNLLARAIDINFINNSYFSDFNYKDFNNTDRVYKMDTDYLKRDLTQFLNGLFFLNILRPEVIEELEAKKPVKISELIEDFKNPLIWRDKRWKELEDALDKVVIKPLTKNSENNRLIHFALSPKHVLLNESEIGKYKPSSIIEALESKEKLECYKNIAITDYSRLGLGPPAFSVGRLLSHASVFNLLDYKKIEDYRDHAICALKRVEDRKDAELKDLNPTYKDEFKELFEATLVYSVLRNLSSVCWMNINNSQKLKEREEREPLYKRKEYINSNINFLSEIKNDTASFKYIVESLNELKLNHFK